MIVNIRTRAENPDQEVAGATTKGALMRITKEQPEVLSNLRKALSSKTFCS